MNPKRTPRRLLAHLPALLALPAGLAVAQPSAPTLPAVEVTGRREVSTATRLDEDVLKLPFPAFTVERAQLDEVGARTLEDALRSVPGLQHGTQGNFFTRFETRGLRDTQDVLVLIDGVPLRLLQGNSDVTLIATDLVERIEFVKGPASALYGRNAIGGIVQFFLAPPQAGGEARVTVGSHGRLDGAVRGRWDFGGGHLFGGVARSRTDGFQRDTGRDQSTVVLGGDVAVTDAWTTGVQLYASSVEAARGSIIPLRDGRPMFGITRRDNFAIPGVAITGDYASLAWKNRLRLGGGWSLEHLSAYAQYDRLFQGGITIVPPPAAVTKGYSETDTADRGLFHDLSVVHRSAGERWTNTLQVGVNLESAWQDQVSPTFTAAPTYRGPAYDTPVSNVTVDPRGRRGASTASRFDQRVDSVYLQDRFEWGTLGLTAGVRHDRFEQTLQRDGTPVVARQEGSRTSPRLGVDWRVLAGPQAEHALFANAAEGYRPQAVALNTRAGVVVPALLRPEVTRSVEAGIKGRAPDGGWFWQASVFQADRTDGQRSFRTGPDTFVFSNATSRVRGLETLGQARLAPGWQGYLHYTFQDARLLDFPTFDDAGRPGPNFAGLRVRMSARHIAGAGLTWSDGPLAVTGTANYVGTRFLRDNTFTSQKLPAYLLLGLAASWRIDRHWTLVAGVDNLTDAYYIADDFSAQDAGNAGAPRSVFARLSYRW